MIQYILTLMYIITSRVSCVPNVASFSSLIALSIFSNAHSLVIITLCWSFFDDTNKIFAFQTKHAKQNVVLKIIEGFLQVLRIPLTIKLTDMIQQKYYWKKRLKIPIWSSEVVNQCGTNNTKSVVKSLNPFT